MNKLGVKNSMLHRVADSSGYEKPPPRARGVVPHTAQCVQQIQAEQAKQREYEAAKASQRATAEAMQRKIQDMEEREKQLIMELRRTQVAQVQAYAELEEKLTD